MNSSPWEEALLGAVKDLQNLTKATQMQSGIQESIWRGAWERIGQSAVDLGFSVIKAGFDTLKSAAKGVADLFKQSVQGAASFRSRLAEVATLGVEDMARLRAGVLDVSSMLGEDLVNATQAVYQAISAGVPEDNVLTFLETAGRGATAGVTDMAVAVDGLTSIVNGLGLAWQDTDKAMDKVFATVKEGKTTFPEIAASIGQVLPGAKALGFSLEEVGGALAELTKRGFNTANAMTVINSIFNQLLAPGAEVRDVIEGIKESAGGMGELDLAKVVEEFGKFGDNLGTVVTESRALKGLLALGEAPLAETIDKIANSTGAADAAFEEFAGTMDKEGGKIKQQLSNALTDVGEPIEKALGETFGNIAEWLEFLLPDAVAAVKGFITSIWEGGGFSKEHVLQIAKNFGLTMEEALAMIGGKEALSPGLKETVGDFIEGVASSLWVGFRNLIEGNRTFAEVMQTWIQEASSDVADAVNDLVKSSLFQSIKQGLLDIAKPLAIEFSKFGWELIKAMTNALTEGVSDWLGGWAFRTLQNLGSPQTYERIPSSLVAAAAGRTEADTATDLTAGLAVAPATPQAAGTVQSGPSIAISMHVGGATDAGEVAREVEAGVRNALIEMDRRGSGTLGAAFAEPSPMLAGVG
jgi:TP901 family phage tail tape measure protein